jgi:hypothetical protein
VWESTKPGVLKSLRSQVLRKALQTAELKVGKGTLSPLLTNRLRSGLEVNEVELLIAVEWLVSLRRGQGPFPDCEVAGHETHPEN